MGRKKFLSLAIMVVVLAVSFPVNTFAADGGSADNGIVALSDNTWERTITQRLTVTYKDYANVNHNLVFTIRCTAAGGWSEGNYGYVSEAVFLTPTDAAIDGQPVPMTKDGTAVETSSTYYQNYIVNNSKMIVKVTIQCDEWGSVIMTAGEVK